jgi:hypothetical protein
MESQELGKSLPQMFLMIFMKASDLDKFAHMESAVGILLKLIQSRTTAPLE